MVKALLYDWPITVAMFLYFIESGIRLKALDAPGALVWFAYGLANVGFVWGYFKLARS